MAVFKISIDSSIVEEFGRNLYDSVPPVLSEIIANSYDADASRVDITIDKNAGKITIIDDGCGMSEDDINKKFLKIGVKKRTTTTSADATTPKFKRLYMGRKGVGKLAIFAIADSFTVETIPQNNLSEKNGFNFDQTELLNKTSLTEFTLPEIACTLDKHGTKITINDVKDNKRYSEETVKYIISRRFPLLDENFKIFVNGSQVSWNDNSGLIKKFQYVFYFGEPDNFEVWKTLFKEHNPSVIIEKISLQEDEENKIPIHGWISTVNSPSELKYQGFSSNNISVIVRKKMAQEDILKTCGNNRHSISYMTGLVFADFLDTDNEPDLSTASRQSIKESATFDKVLNYSKNIINKVSDRWSELRQQKEDDKIKAIPAIKEWLNEQEKDKDISDLSQQYIKHIGKIVSSLNISRETSSPEEVSTLCEGAILSYEHAKRAKTVKNLISKIEKQSTDENKGMFNTYASQYTRYVGEAIFPIIEERLRIISKLQECMNNKSIEKDFQILLHQNLWLIRPLWENIRYTLDDTYKNKLEEYIKTEVGDEVVTGRIDISVGIIDMNPVIIELKKYDVSTTMMSLNEQITKYRKFISEQFNDMNHSKKEFRPIEPKDVLTYIILGKRPVDWEDQDIIKSGWESKNVKVLCYDELLYDAKNQYKRYIDENMTANKVINNITKIREEVAAAFSNNESTPPQLEHK